MSTSTVNHFPLICSFAVIDNVRQELQCEENTLTEFSANLPLLEADATRLRLLFRNLISNALKHGQSEKPILIKLHSDHHRVTAEITDYGPGIGAEHLDKLTEPFYRADPSRARATGGFGMGLHISDLIAKAHGGALQFDSNLGAGTTVTLTLPLPADR